MSTVVGGRRGVRTGAQQGVRGWATLFRTPAGAWLALAALALGTAALLFHETRGTTAWFDEWIWILHRRGGSVGSFLDSYNGHLSLVPVAIYKLLWATAGLRTYVPYRALLIVGHLTCCTLLFVYAQRRVGGLLAVVAAALLLLFGPGWENLLWPFQITWLLSLGGGLGALLALDRHDRRGDVAACVLLALALASSGIGVPIALGVIVELALRRRRWERWWIVGIPVALYVLWSIAYQSTTITANSLTASPNFVATGLAASFGALAGLGGNTGQDGPGSLMTFGPTLLVAALALAAWRLIRLRRIPPRTVALATMLLSFWVITALTRSGFGNPYSSRYLYVSALLLILVAVELGRAARRIWWVEVTIVVVAAAAVLSNVGAIRDEAGALRSEAQAAKADLGALQIARPVISPGYVAQDLPGYPFVQLTAGGYFAAAHALGTPAASPSAILADPEPVRAAVDRELIGIHGVGLGMPSIVAAAPGSCTTFRPAASDSAGTTPQTQLQLPPAGLLIRSATDPISVSIRRFAAQFQPLGTVNPSSTASLRIQPDASARPWHVLLGGSGPVTVCSLGPGN
jgi:hypothetical protein